MLPITIICVYAQLIIQLEVTKRGSHVVNSHQLFLDQTLEQM